MIKEGIPKTQVSVLAGKTVWYSLLAILAITVFFGLDDTFSSQLQEAAAVSESLSDHSGITTQRSFVRGMSESLSVISAFGGPTAPTQSFTRTLSDNVSITTGFAPPHSSIARTIIDNTSFRNSQFYQNSSQRIEERLNLKNLSNSRNDVMGGKGHGSSILTIILPESSNAHLSVIRDLSKEFTFGSNDGDASPEDDNSFACVVGYCVDSQSFGHTGHEIVVAFMFSGMVIVLSFSLTFGALKHIGLVILRHMENLHCIGRRQFLAVFLLVILFLAIPSNLILPSAYAARIFFDAPVIRTDANIPGTQTVVTYTVDGGSPLTITKTQLGATNLPNYSTSNTIVFTFQSTITSQTGKVYEFSSWTTSGTNMNCSGNTTSTTGTCVPTNNGGGNNGGPIATYGYKASISDVLSTSDLISITKVSVRNLPNTLIVSDSLIRTQKIKKSIVENIDILDGISTLVSRSVSDSVTIIDSLTRQRSVAKSVADVVTITDLATRELDATRSMSDTLFLSDSINANTAFARSLSDALTITVGADRTLAANRFTADTMTLEDSTARTHITSRTTTDTLTIDDHIATVKSYNRAVFDSMTTTDSAITIYSTSRSVGDIVILSDSATAGNHFDRSVSDSVIIIDVVSMGVSRNLSDSASITDGITPDSVTSRLVSDSVAITDIITPTLSSSRSISDTTTIDDSLTQTLTTSRSISDSIAIADAITAGKHFDRAASDSIAATDAISTRVSRTVSDSVAASDSVLPGILASRSLPDSLAISDSISTTTSRSVGDSLSITDSVAAGNHFDRSVVDSIALADNVLAAYLASRPADDIVIVEDSISTHVSRSIADSVSISESATAGKHFDRSPSDSLSVEDIISITQTRNITDTISTTDTIHASLTATRSILESIVVEDASNYAVGRSTVDALSVTDEILAEKAFGKSVFDSVSVADNTTATLASSRSLQDSVSVSDNITTAYHATRSISDTMVVEDESAGGKSFARQIGDTFAIAETLSRTLAFSRIVSEDISVSDGSNRMIVLAVSVSDNIVVNTDVTAGNAFERETSDSLTVSDAISILYGPTMPLAESLTIGDSVAVGLGPNRSIAELITFTDLIVTSVSTSRTISDSLTVTEGVGDLFQISLLDSLQIQDLIEPEVPGRTIELADTVNVNVQLHVSVNYHLDFGEPLTLGECTPFACNQSLNFYETVALNDDYLPPPKLNDIITVSDSIAGAKSFGRLIADSLTVQHNVDFIVKFPTPTQTGSEVPDLRVQIATNKNLVPPMPATSVAGTYTMTTLSNLLTQLNPPTATLSTTVTAPDLPKLAVVLPTYHVNMNSTPQLPGKDAMLTVKVAQIPAETPVVVPVNMANTPSMNKTPEIPWMKVDFTPNAESNDFALLITVLEEAPMGAQEPPANLKPMYVDVKWVGKDSNGNDSNMSDPNYYKADGKPTFTFAATDEWANANNAERDSNGVPLITLNLLNDATGEWTLINALDRPTSANENGQYVFVAHLEHFSTYVITANAVTVTPSGSGRTAPASFAVRLLDSLRLSEQQRVLPIEIIDEFGGRTFNVVIADRLTVSTRPVAYQTFQVSEDVNVSIALQGIIQEGIFPQTAKATFSIQVSNTGASNEIFQLNFWYYDQSGRRAYESSQEIQVGPFETREYSINVPFNSAGTFAIVAEARSVPEGKLLNTTQFTVNIPWLSIYLYSLLSVAAVIIATSTAAVAVLLARRNVATSSMLAVPPKRIAGAATLRSLIRIRATTSAQTKSTNDSPRQTHKLTGDSESVAGAGSLSLSINLANAMHGSLLIGERTALIDIDAVNTTNGQIFLIKYWAVDSAGEVVYSYSETIVVDPEKPKTWRLPVELPKSGDYMFHVECKSARDDRLVNRAKLTIKAP